MLFGNDSSRRRFRYKVTTTPNNRTPPDKRLDAKRSDTPKDRAAGLFGGVPGNGCVLDRIKSLTSRSNGTKNQRSVDGISIQGHPSGRITKRQAKPFWLILLVSPECLGWNVGGCKAPYFQSSDTHGEASQVPRERLYP